MVAGLLMLAMALLAIFLILLILVQRGRGGGLAGALGGMGGQSAFGTKAGDLFTRVTIVVATIWILVAMLAVKYLGGIDNPLANLPNAPPAVPGGAQPGPGAGGNAATGEKPAGSGEQSQPASGTTTPENTPQNNEK